MFDFKDSNQYLSISKIYVSSWASVLNGKKNWGIPKERADFTIEKLGHRREKIVVAKDGHQFADIEIDSFGLKLPFTGGVIPKRLRTLAQVYENQTFYYTPGAKGNLSFSKVRKAVIDPDYFPNISEGRILAAIKVTDFKMHFPVSRIE